MYLKIHRSVKRPWQRPCSGVIRCGLCPIFVDTSGIESVNFVWFSKYWCKFVISPVVHLLRWNGHRKRILSIFSKTTTRVVFSWKCRLIVFVWTHENGGSLISIVLPFSCGQPKTIRIRQVYTHFFRKLRKNLRFQKYPDTCGGGVKHLSRWLVKCTADFE